MEDSRSAQVHAVEATRNTAGPRGSKRTEFEAAAASGRGASRAALDLGEYEGELPIACDEFTLDVTQSYGLCVCGAPRAAHRDQSARPRSGSGGAVARLVARHEAHIREARAEALRALAEADALALERNAQRAREALAKRRQKAVAKIDAAKRKGACLAPTFANVAERSSELVLEVTCATPGCLIHYFHARPRDGGVDEAKLAKHDPAVDGVLRLAAKEPGTHLIIAKASKAGMEDSELATGCFRLEPPSFLFAEVHDHELRSLHLPSECDEGPVPAKCSVCGAALANGDGYADRARDFAVCMARARVEITSSTRLQCAHN